MTWVDGIIILVGLAVILWEARQEAGRSLLDTVAVLSAAHLSSQFAPAVTAGLRWKPLPGTETSPGAHALLFFGVLVGGLILARAIHRQMRWSMDQFDWMFGLAFACVITVTAGHVATDLAARQAIHAHGKLPAYLDSSLLASELREFRSYHYVVNTFHGLQYSGE